MSRAGDRAAISDGIALSIVCATRNAEVCLRHLLASYESSCRTGTEFIVVDGGSTDGTLKIIDAHRHLVQHVISGADEGIYDAWNKALPVCRGHYVAYIGADDQIAAGAVEALVAACRPADGESPDLVAGYVLLTRGGLPVALLGGPYDPRRALFRMPVAHVMAAHRRAWLEAEGGFDTSFRSSGDYELLLRGRSRLKVQTVPRVLAYMADGGTSRRFLRPRLEDFRARRKNGVSLLLASALLSKAFLGAAWRRLSRT